MATAPSSSGGISNLVLLKLSLRISYGAPGLGWSVIADCSPQTILDRWPKECLRWLIVHHPGSRAVPASSDRSFLAKRLPGRAPDRGVVTLWQWRTSLPR